MTYQVFCLGNPLLDVQVRDGEALLKKYDLQANNAILAEEKHQPVCVSTLFTMHDRHIKWITDDWFHHSYEEIVKNYPVTYVAGGASQNAARGAAVSIYSRSCAFSTLSNYVFMYA